MAEDERIKSRHVLYREQNREKLRAASQKFRAEHPGYKKRYIEYDREYRRKHPEVYRAHNRRSRTKLKGEVLIHYGNGRMECVICHDTRIQVLTIDHIYGNGRKHRQEIGGSSKSLYCWLRRSGYPEGFRTLCGSCQMLENARKRGEEVEVWDWNNHCNTVEGFISPTMQGPTSG